MCPGYVCGLGEEEDVLSEMGKELVPGKEAGAIDLGPHCLTFHGAGRSGKEAEGEKPIWSGVPSIYYTASGVLNLK